MAFQWPNPQVYKDQKSRACSEEFYFHLPKYDKYSTYIEGTVYQKDV